MSTQSRFGLGFDMPRGSAEEPDEQPAPAPASDEEIISPADIAAQTASHLEQEKAAEAAFQALSPAERIAELLSQMAPRRKELLAILNACAAPTSFEDVERVVAPIQKNCKTVFDSANLCAVLERCGGLRRVTEDGSDYPAEAFEPQVIENADGSKSLKPVEPPAVYWETTPEGAQAAAGDNPAVRLHAMLAEEPQYLPIYERVLAMSCEDGGTTTKALGQAIDKDPLVQSPRYFAMHFTERLEADDAIEWADNAWRATELGKQALCTIRENQEH